MNELRTDISKTQKEGDIFNVKDILTSEQLADRLSISVDYIAKHAPIMVGFFKIGGQVRFDWSEISIAIKQKKNLIQKMRRYV